MFSWMLDVKHVILFTFINRLVYCEISNSISDGENRLNGKNSSDVLKGIEDGLELKSYVFWPNGTIPFYIHPEHFDGEQSKVIMTALSLFAFKTCLKFMPLLAPPEDTQHVLYFENPEGRRACSLKRSGHSWDEPHRVPLGYDCLKSPKMEMVIMRAMGFPFEHCRGARDMFIDVQEENIEQSALELFTKDHKLPMELRNLPYDVDSVMHFEERAYSKNGHRTFMIKDRNIKQKHDGLSEIDLRKIAIVYGPECLKRDRQEKIEICQAYPGVARKKREVDLSETTKSLRVNPNITPPPEVVASKNLSDHVKESVKQLNVAEEVQNVVESVFKLSAKALANAREKHCNSSRPVFKTIGDRADNNNKKTDIRDIVSMVVKYAETVVEDALSNLTVFCESTDSMEKYQRYGCGGNDNSGRCWRHYKSTYSIHMKISTQHRPYIVQSTKHGRAGYNKSPYEKLGSYRSRNDSEIALELEKDGKKTVVNFSKEDKDDKEKGRQKRHQEAEAGAKNHTGDLRLGRTVMDERLPAKDSQARRNDRPQIRNEESLRERLPPRKKKSRNIEERKESKSRQREETMSVKQIEPREHTRQHADHDETKRPRKAKKKIEKAKSSSEEARNDNNAAFRAVVLSKSNEEFYSQRRWPNGVVRYIIDVNKNYNMDDLRIRLSEVNTILKRRTCTRLEEIRGSQANKYEDYLVLDNSPDYVTGRVGGRQIFGSVELLSGGQHRQHAAMMVMAMLGFYFEVSRHDRDKYVRVHNRHVRPDKLHHFEKIRPDATLNLPYDYKSATHPAWQFWRKIGKTGISTVATYKEKDTDGSIMKSLGQHSQLLSDIDIIKINSVYGVKCMKVERRQQSHGRHRRQA